ncbi:hypothetical protein [Algivirga pacifica]|uniref:Uncharacterized protein n=1 Tax=Algivirga pacifica TaxID=1162670 RepID=A0ABP9CZ55_9BACT
MDNKNKSGFEDIFGDAIRELIKEGLLHVKDNKTSNFEQVFRNFESFAKDIKSGKTEETVEVEIEDLSDNAEGTPQKNTEKELALLQEQIALLKQQLADKDQIIALLKQQLELKK